jgi:hypothetical protein
MGEEVGVLFADWQAATIKLRKETTSIIFFIAVRLL